MLVARPLPDKPRTCRAESIQVHCASAGRPAAVSFADVARPMPHSRLLQLSAESLRVKPQSASRVPVGARRALHERTEGLAGFGQRVRT